MSETCSYKAYYEIRSSIAWLYIFSKFWSFPAMTYFPNGHLAQLLHHRNWAHVINPIICFKHLASLFFFILLVSDITVVGLWEISVIVLYILDYMFDLLWWEGRLSLIDDACSKFWISVIYTENLLISIPYDIQIWTYAIQVYFNKGGLNHASLIPAGFRSFLWNPEESKLAQSPAKMTFWGMNIPAEWCHSWLVAGMVPGMDKKECIRNGMTRIPIIYYYY